MKYRIIKSGKGFWVECKYRFWPWWTRLFDFGHNFFDTVDAAETAIRKLIENHSDDGWIVKVLNARGVEIK